MLTLFLLAIKNFLPRLVAFLDTKAGHIIALVGLEVLALWYANHRGYEDGVSHQVAIQVKEYQAGVAKALSTQAVKQTEAVKQGVETAKQTEKIIYVTKDKVQHEIQYIETHPSKKGCDMPNDEFVDYYQKLKDIK